MSLPSHPTLPQAPTSTVVTEVSWDDALAGKFPPPRNPRWQHAAVKAAEQMHQQPALQPTRDRLTKALELVLTGAVTLHADGTATVKSGRATYPIAEAGCKCDDAKRRTPHCPHVLAVDIHRRATALLEGRPQEPSAAASPSPAESPRTSASAAWDVHEAPLSSCIKLRLGACEWTHTVRAADEAELHTRFQAFRALVHDMAAELNELALRLDAAHLALREALERKRTEATAAPAATASPPNGQARSTQPPAAPDQPAEPPECLYHGPMRESTKAKGTWYCPKKLSDGSFCKERWPHKGA